MAYSKILYGADWVAIFRFISKGDYGNGTIAMASSSGTDFIVWGIDQTAYGPVELPTLVSWVKDERVTAETWVFAARTSSWQKAPQVPELQMFFRPKSNGTSGPVAIQSVEGVDARALR